MARAMTPSVAVDSPTSLTDHGQACCAAARAWVAGIHLAASAGEPLDVAWIAERFPWGPVLWPVAWCDLPDMEVGDCGLHAAVAEHSLACAGVTVRRVQLIMRYGPAELDHWRRLWEEASADAAWVADGTCYHEAVAVGSPRVRVLDATEAVEWSDPATDGIAAMRILGPPANGGLTWNGVHLPLGVWTSF